MCRGPSYMSSLENAVNEPPPLVIQRGGFQLNRGINGPEHKTLICYLEGRQDWKTIQE